MSIEYVATNPTESEASVSDQADIGETRFTPSIAAGDTPENRVSDDHLRRLSKDSRQIVVRLVVMGGLFLVGVALAPQDASSVVVGYYFLAVYAGWRFLNEVKIASRAIELLSKVVSMAGGFFMPGWLESILEAATTVAMKLGFSIVLGVVLAPIEVARNIYELIRLRGLRRDVVEGAA